MTVVRRLPEQLILAHAPWLFGGFLIVCIVGCCAAGLLLLFAGQLSGLLTVLLGGSVPVALFGMTVKRDQVIFDSIANTITLQRQSLWEYSCDTVPLSALVHADTEALSDTSRPVLHLRIDEMDAVVPLVQAHMAGHAALTTARTINAWHAELRQRHT